MSGSLDLDVNQQNPKALGTWQIEDEHELDGGRREMVLNMGPQHPSTHGVMRVVLTLEGETIVAADPVIGYLHRGVEKIGETRRYAQFTPWTDRTDYVAAPLNNLGYILTVEKLCGIVAPERAQYLRVIMAELTRIASHMVWLGTHAIDIGALSMVLYTFTQREHILDIFEMFCGARLTTNMMEIGGFSRPDLPEGLIEKIEAFLAQFPAAQQEWVDLLQDNPIWIARTKGVGVIEPQVALDYGLTGACLRGSGINYDIRKAQPYLVYDRFDFEVPLGTQGDVYDRYLVRMEELRQTLKILRQALDQMPTDGPLMAHESNYVIPPHDTVLRTAEDMQRHFVWVTKGFSPPKGEVYVGIEHSKGELGHYLVSDGTPYPYRLRIRTPDFVNLQVLPYMAEGAMLADSVALIGTIDIVLGSVDR
jgi:NADH dehydrogenase I D subunit